MQVHWDFENACKVSAAPPELDPARFRSAFFRDVVGAGGAPLRVESGPATASWVPLAELSPYVESALLVTEDGRFYRHDGFDDRAIESAIRANTSAGRFVRGASTLSMQLAKNLYLTREKTLARKLQEAALTVLLEQSFEKRELLELYVNSVEFGPGVYGIGPAAEYYFRTEASQLGAAQAFFLASILPAPTRQYFGADGRLSPARAALVRRLLEIAKQRKLLGDHELAVALASELVFGQPVSSAPPSGAGAADAPTPPPGAAP
jgi:membrane peptidoglycan carboxypeptidase